MLWPKKNSYKEFDNEKKFLRLENSPPTHNRIIIYKYKYSRKGKLNEKNSYTPINPKKYSSYDLKNILTRNLITKKNSCCLKIPHPS